MRERNISTEWFFGCKDKEQRDARKGLVDSAAPVLDVLVKMLEQRRETYAMKASDYDVAAWPYYQAHRNGQMEELDRLIKLIGSVTNNE